MSDTSDCSACEDGYICHHGDGCMLDAVVSRYEMSEREHWEAWQRGEMRCPMCVGLDMDEFEAVCDCSRYSLETTGHPITIQVVGRPDTAQTVLPHRIVEP